MFFRLHLWAPDREYLDVYDKFRRNVEIDRSNRLCTLKRL
jgi:hypothetical protein